MGRWLSVSFHLIWPLQGQIGHTVSRRSAAAPLRGGGGSLQAGPLRGHVAVGLVKSSYLVSAAAAASIFVLDCPRCTGRDAAWTDEPPARLTQ